MALAVYKYTLAYDLLKIKKLHYAVMCIIQSIETESFIIYIFKQYLYLINEGLKIMSLLGHQPVPPKTVENFLPRNALKNLMFVQKVACL